jgi:hypothetical protein
MTKQEVEQSFPYRAVKKILKRTYPFIVRFAVPDDVEQYSSLIFLDIYIDIYKLKELMPKYEIDNFYTKYYIKSSPSERKSLWGVANFASFFEGGTTNSQERVAYFRPLVKDIEDILHNIGRSEEIPRELRLKDNRTFDIANFYIDIDTLMSGLPSQH